MSGLNKVILIGNLVRDPEFKQVSSAFCVANVTVATSNEWTDKDTNERKSEAQFHRVLFTNKLAEIVNKYLVKGSKVYVEGQIKYKKYTDKAGIERFVTEIVAKEMQMLSPKTGAASGDYEQSEKLSYNSNKLNSQAVDFADDDIPF